MKRNNYTLEPNYIVNIPCRKIREIARNVLKNNWIKVTLAFALYYIFTTLVSNLLNIPFSYEISQEQMADSVANMFNLSKDQLLSALKNTNASSKGIISYGGIIYEYIICPSFNLGLCMFLFAFFRKRKTNITMIFDGMSYWIKAVWLMILITIKSMLWSFLFIIPGIIAAIRYSLSFFVLADHPDWTASECIRESSRLMRGNKLKFILLSLSFAGWLLLACIPSAFVGDFIEINEFMRCFANAFFAIPVMFVNAYYYVSLVAFYELAAGNMKIKRVDSDEINNENGITKAFNNVKDSISNPENAVQKILNSSLNSNDSDREKSEDDKNNFK